MKKTIATILTDYPILPLLDIVMFPGMVSPLFISKERSIKAIEHAFNVDKKILLFMPKDQSAQDNAHNIGVIGNILQLLKLQDGNIKALIEAEERVKITSIIDYGPFAKASAKLIPPEEYNNTEIKALCRSVLSIFEQYIKITKRIPGEMLASLNEIRDVSQLADIIASHLFVKLTIKQRLLEITNVMARLEYLFNVIEEEIEILDTEKKIKTRVKKQVEKNQKEYYLNEQLKAIHKELGDGHDQRNEASNLEKQIEQTLFTKEAAEKAKAELKKLKTTNANSAEATIIRNYLDWLLAMPWGKFNDVKIDLAQAEKMLDMAHYGLVKVKERILEYLAVQQRISKIKGPILCLVGPPGVGKTSLAKSIAKATNREFVRFSLGGVRDEAEIRGHRRTYLGAMPGKIIQYLKKAKSSNPVFLLDEIDKLGVDFRGDPASSLLEVLDPEQNKNFIDHYLEVEYDLSNVMFIATANSLNIPPALLDRMEVIKVHSYTEEEKLAIATQHLVPKQITEHGLMAKEWSITQEAVLSLIRFYTREAGVRNLERELANLARKAVKKILSTPTKSVKISEGNLKKYAGVQKFTFGKIEHADLTGVTTGLAYTEVGGVILSIEAVCLPGKGNIKTTGKLGEVMQESAQAAFSYFKSKCLEFGVTPEYYQEKDIHLHVPEGATNKDGPSAGIAMFTSIVSIMTGLAVKKTVAMTGEITLRGRVLAIGGLKEKLLAALRGGIKTVIIPQDNMKDLAEMPENVRKKLKIIPVSLALEVLAIALVKAPVSLVTREEKLLPNTLPKELVFSESFVQTP